MVDNTFVCARNEVLGELHELNRTQQQHLWEDQHGSSSLVRQEWGHHWEATSPVINAKVCYQDHSSCTLSPYFHLQLKCAHANHLIGQAGLLSGKFLCLVGVTNLILFLCRRKTWPKSSQNESNHCFGQAARRWLHRRWRKAATTSQLNKSRPKMGTLVDQTKMVAIWNRRVHVNVRYPQPMMWPQRMPVCSSRSRLVWSSSATTTRTVEVS